METIYVQRLLALAHHLLYGVLGHSKFDFSNYNCSMRVEDYNEQGCGTNGCAIGECPIIFKEWEFRREAGYEAQMHPEYIPVLKREALQGLPKLGSLESGTHFFGISNLDYYKLFTPNTESVAMFGGKFLNGYATKEKVANNMVLYLNFKLNTKATLEQLIEIYGKYPTK